MLASLTRPGEPTLEDPANLYVIEEGYVVALTTAASGGNDNIIQIRDRNGNSLLDPHQNNMSGLSERLVGTDMFMLGYGIRNGVANSAVGDNEWLTDGLDLVYFRTSADRHQDVEGWVNPLFAKAIYPGAAYPTEANGFVENSYSIRSPRQLENIINVNTRTGTGKTGADGNFTQEININLDTNTNLNDRTRYTKVIYRQAQGNSAPLRLTPALRFRAATVANPRAVVNGNFTGTYTTLYDHGFLPFLSTINSNDLTQLLNHNTNPPQIRTISGIFHSAVAGRVSAPRVENDGLFHLVRPGGWLPEPAAIDLTGEFDLSIDTYEYEELEELEELELYEELYEELLEELYEELHEELYEELYEEEALVEELELEEDLELCECVEECVCEDPDEDEPGYIDVAIAGLPIYLIGKRQKSRRRGRAKHLPFDLPARE
jgi:hypothetical protein